MLQTRTIYSLLLPQEESYRFAKDTLMIREETLPDIGVTEACLTSAVANKFSAFFVNDIVCLVMVPFVLNITRRMKLPPLPYLLAVATASNIGSVATITGNPQNMLIGSFSGIKYRTSFGTWARSR